MNFSCSFNWEPLSMIFLTTDGSVDEVVAGWDEDADEVNCLLSKQFEVTTAADVLLVIDFSFLSFSEW